MIGDSDSRDDHIARHLAIAENNLDLAHEVTGGAYPGPTSYLLAAIAHDLHALALMLGLNDEDDEPPTQEREEP